jgi:predicted site-specific integrase-resolvase
MKRHNPKAAANYLGVSEHTLNNWRAQGIGPRYLRIGAAGSKGRIFYPEPDLDSFLSKCVVETSDTRGVA